MTQTSASPSTLEACRQCGTCCRKGGPALHQGDRRLVESGRLPLAALLTLRQGQMVRDNVRNELVRLTADVIKIKPVAGSSACIYLTPANTCGIYDHRPLECRLLKCWNTQALIRSYPRERLTRQDLIGGVPELWDLVRTHQARCDYTRIYPLIRTLRSKATPSAVPPELGEIIVYDAHLRSFIEEKAPPFKNQAPFLLGQPLAASLAPLGIQLTRTSAGWRIRDTVASC